MAQSVFAVQHVDDDSWRRELCPDCGARLFGLAAWKEHAPHHGWGSEWLAARVRAGRAGEVIGVSAGALGEGSNSHAAEAVEGTTRVAGGEARLGHDAGAGRWRESAGGRDRAHGLCEPR